MNQKRWKCFVMSYPSLCIWYMITANTYLNVCRNDNTKEIRMERKELDYRIKDEQLLFIQDNTDARINWYNAVLHNLLASLFQVQKGDINFPENFFLHKWTKDNAKRCKNYDSYCWFRYILSFKWW